MDRNFKERFRRDWLAIEEVTAELTASFVLADLDRPSPRSDHAACVASWLRLLEDDPRAIFTAASKAQQVADWTQSLDPDHLIFGIEIQFAETHPAAAVQRVWDSCDQETPMGRRNYTILLLFSRLGLGGQKRDQFPRSRVVVA